MALERSENAAAAAIALHYENAGATGEAIRWHERSAVAAQWLHAHANAVRALERALALSEDLPPGLGTARLQLRLLTALPAPLLALEGYASERMTRVHTRALQLAGQLGSEPEPRLMWSLAMAALTPGSGSRPASSVSGCGPAPSATMTRSCGWKATTCGRSRPRPAGDRAVRRSPGGP